MREAHTGRVQTIVFDNSALSNLLNSDELCENVRSLVRHERVRFVVVWDALEESLLGASVPHIAARLGRLASLIRSSPPHLFVLARPSITWLRREWRGRGLFTNIPNLASSQRYRGIMEMMTNQDQLAGFHAALAEARQEQFNRRERLSEVDREFRIRILDGNGDPAVRETLRNYTLPVRFSELSGLTRAFWFLPRFSNRKVRRVLRRPDRHRLLRTYIALVHIRALGNALDPSIDDPGLSFLYGIVDGNWYDLSYIAVASIVDALVTDDIAQRSLTNFARDRGLISCSGVGLNEFFEQNR